MLILKGGIVHDGQGNVYVGADVAIENGKFIDVAAVDVSCAEIISVEGKHIFPGFINPLTSWGGRTASGGNHLDERVDPVTPDIDVTYSFDHDGMTFNRAWRYGITAAGVAPGPINILGGMGAVYKTYGHHPMKMLIKEKAFMMASVTKAVKSFYGKKERAPMTGMALFAMLRECLKKADAYIPGERYAPKEMAMKKVLSGEIPLIVNCALENEIDALQRLLVDFPKVRYILSGAYEVKERHFNSDMLLGMITGDYINCDGNPYGDKTINHADMPGFIRSGRVIAGGCSGDRSANSSIDLMLNSILWRNMGLSEEETVVMLTGACAKLLGVDDRIGAIRPGLDADFSVWSDNPFNTYAARLERVCINGEPLPLVDEVKTCW